VCNGHYNLGSPRARDVGAETTDSLSPCTLPPTPVTPPEPGFSPPGIQFTNANSGSTPPLYEMWVASPDFCLEDGQTNLRLVGFRWNTPKFTREFSSFHATYTPPLMQSYRPKIEPFAKRVYETGIKLLRLIALALEIPEEHGGEDFFTKLHAYGNECGFAGDTWRYMLVGACGAWSLGVKR